MSNWLKFPFLIRGTALPNSRGSIAANRSKLLNSLNLLLSLRLFLLISSHFLSRRALSQMLGSCIVQQWRGWRGFSTERFNLTSISSIAIPSARAFEISPLYHWTYFLFKKLLWLRWLLSPMAETNCSYLEALEPRIYCSPAALTELNPSFSL